MANSPGTVLVTGGTGLLGRAIVKNLLDHDYKVLFTSRSQQRADALVSELGGDDRIVGITVDLQSRTSASVVLAALERLGASPVGLVNNARNADHLRLQPNGSVDRSHWLAEFELDVVTAYEVTLALAMASGSRLVSVVNVSSIYGVVAVNPNLYDEPAKQSPIHYSVAKAALIHLSRELAVRLATKGIRVNAVSFGGVAGRNSEAFAWRYAQLCPAGTMLDPDDVPGAVEFLLSNHSRGVTGQNLIVDGGWTAW